MIGFSTDGEEKEQAADKVEEAEAEALPSLVAAAETTMPEWLL
eukprot:CAMPEP_0171892370 /NCGR_PEP_ID=MMETSP0992-20121227/45265_1 /TAXON_ID=483369 /ORGANISM="non described non described, Strain CCMP2098" /LENGTH=42 /DNA_ID= /DNA_START= /DNA_END= /DNA_ORIENTATION=